AQDRVLPWIGSISPPLQPQNPTGSADMTDIILYELRSQEVSHIHAILLPTPHLDQYVATEDAQYPDQVLATCNTHSSRTLEKASGVSRSSPLGQ
ncbi:hypothetical protein SARC_13401, partial [Sphaeroforma arctica JP610]